MAELDPLELTTRREKVIAAAAALGSVAAHIVVFFLAYADPWPAPEPEEKKLMIVRRVPEAPPLAPLAGPASRQVLQRKEAVVEKGKPPEPGSQTPKPDKAQEQRPEAPPPEEGLRAPEADRRENTVSIYTDLGEAFFRLDGPVSHKGAGTFWEKKGLPAGDYKVTFGTLAGYETPPPQTGTLKDGGSLTFTGRYTKMTLVSVDVNLPQARFKIIRPDGKELSLGANRQGYFKDLPIGIYTIVFDDVPGYGAPTPQNRNLGAGGYLAFSGTYTLKGGGGGQKLAGGTGLEERTRKASPPGKVMPGPRLDRRIKLVVKSYPETSIESNYGLIEYPEKDIKKSNYQEGWCQVYLVLKIDSQGTVSKVEVQRPRRDERELFAPLIAATERSVLLWDFDPKAAEVHVDVRFYVEK